MPVLAQAAPVPVPAAVVNLKHLDHPMPQTLSEGMYQYDIKDGDYKSRIHLRVDSDLSGILLVNA